MSHFAKVVDGIVTQVIVAEEDFFETFIDTSPGQWLKTSYNTIAGEHKTGGIPFRKNFAGIGFSYDKEKDAFIPPKPFESWTLDEDMCVWIPPVEHPGGNKPYIWNEEKLQWVEVQ